MSIERISAEELLERHRAATISRGDIVRAIVVLADRVSLLEKRISELEAESR